jgi:hypothetical protein
MPFFVPQSVLDEHREVRRELDRTVAWNHVLNAEVLRLQVFIAKDLLPLLMAHPSNVTFELQMKVAKAAEHALSPPPKLTPEDFNIVKHLHGSGDG